jgi:hypothetical protein
MNLKFWKKTKPNKHPCINCIVRPICNFSKTCNEIEMDEDKLRDLFLKYKCCPDCGSEKFFEGPKGGMSTNVRCGGCKHEFNMTLPICVERINAPGRMSGVDQSP